MAMGRMAVLTAEQETDLKAEIEALWSKRKRDGKPEYTGTRIADLLKFGIKGSKWEAVPRNYIYYYRDKFRLPTRNDYRGYKHRYKYGKQEEPIDLYSFIEKIESMPEDTYHQKRLIAFLVLVFWTGLRQGEVRLLTVSDFKIRGEKMLINAFREKKGRLVSRELRVYPLELRTTWFYVDRIVKWVGRFKNPEDRPWGFSSKTAWRYVKMVFERGYPHYFRLNRINALCSDNRFNLAEIRAFTGLHLTTIDWYVSRSSRYAASVAQKVDSQMRESRG